MVMRITGKSEERMIAQFSFGKELQGINETKRWHMSK